MEPDVLLKPMYVTAARANRYACAAVQITFYGLKTDAAMAAAIFEVGYNSVLHLSQQEMKGKGARAMLDYRCAPVLVRDLELLGYHC